jgi:hypothetical protein
VHAGGPWEEQPAAPARIRLIRLTGSAPLQASLLRGFVREGVSQVWTRSVAEQRPVTAFTDGLFPGAPLAQNSVGPHYGLRIGQRHTLLWAANPSLATGNVCEGDATALAATPALGANPPAPRAADHQVREAILWDAEHYPRRIGEKLRPPPAIAPLVSATIIERIHQDTDPASVSYAQYAASGIGNGRRIIAAPIQSPERRLLQVGAFFLLPAVHYRRGDDQPVCAEYIGAYLQGSKRRGAAESGFYLAALLR